MDEERIVIIGKNISKHLTSPRAWRAVQRHVSEEVYQSTWRLAVTQMLVCIVTTLFEVESDISLLLSLSISLGWLICGGLFRKPDS